jgi:hypothetical protein
VAGIKKLVTKVTSVGRGEIEGRALWGMSRKTSQQPYYLFIGINYACLVLVHYLELC